MLLADLAALATALFSGAAAVCNVSGSNIRRGELLHQI